MNWDKSGNGDGYTSDRMDFVTGMGYDPVVAYYWRRAEELDILDAMILPELRAT
jgi:hypothetical protein